MRKYKLDELPQFLNVLKGDMSFVGPRPEVPEYTALYTAEEKLILTVRPGITDFSSLKFIDLDSLLGQTDPDKVYREQIMPQKNALRMRYVNECSMSTDLWIIGMTLLRLVKR
ncbi:undecaprenyl phosphate N,N'-diacetylbacillosamine 1-phosphate transferase [mine drainage metagenome]|uniref:Undecaprenyl phosphate N,N'-diacetylbacillosamine 1-phosphate transferase n=1 Tax=mine drainage metagenome TaxID=410659 RepID=A0A1J5PH24_9ZZZZ